MRRALNMYRGEIYAYAMYLQKELSSAGTVGFFRCDVACKYWPNLQKVVQACPELEELLKMHPLLSVMHAKVHEWSRELKWGGRNQPGADHTTGEEVKQVNSFISRAAVTTKYMSKAVRTDIITLLAMGWNKRKFTNMDRMLAKRYVKNVKRLKEETSLLEEKQAELDINDTVLQEWTAEVQQWPEATLQDSQTGQTGHLQKKIEGLYLSVKQRKYYLYRLTDGNKRRHQILRKIVEDKAALTTAIVQLHEQQAEFRLPTVDELLNTDNFVWPWQRLGTSNSHLAIKKAIFDRLMLVNRLQEEEWILGEEMKRHWGRR
ncbi:hypothetical protein J4Q44_G00326790 [Coregonus suidteri]|uniref:Uncharacterized protein n=1 Tax=Coregonus suidteri TaxID=861788 RepID=A0AAN8KPW2_9TELE